MTNYFSFQHFRKMNVRFMLLKKIPLCMKLSVIMLFICVGLAYASDSYSQNVLLNIDVNNNQTFISSTITNKLIPHVSLV